MTNINYSLLRPQPGIQHRNQSIELNVTEFPAVTGPALFCATVASASSDNSLLIIDSDKRWFRAARQNIIHLLMGLLVLPEVAVGSVEI